MSTVIAISGKGGTGKTTFAALVIGYLLEEGMVPVLAVDADSNSNLDMALGVDLGSTVGAVREAMSEKVRKRQLPAGMAKQDLLQMQIEQALVETKDFDLVSMGRAEGPGCYCAINNMLRVFLDSLAENYRFVVVDNEAGMEHLSRRTARGVDVMFVVSDPSRRGLETAARIRALARELKLEIRKIFLVVSRVREPVGGDLERSIESTGMDLAGVIPEDEQVSRLDVAGKPLTELPPDSTAVEAVRNIMENVLQEVKS
ncbi:MAG: AAA family ATPase [Actinobacteria bacterium]|nr:AAA family ATPase [Actinomycetota bacterium]